MKVDRDKRHKRILLFYKQYYDAKSPYRIIMDFEFISHCKLKKLGNVKELFPKLFGAKAYPMVTECMVKEAFSLHANDYSIVKYMSTFERAQCGHTAGMEKASIECLEDALQSGRYCFAGREKNLLSLCYKIPQAIVLMWDPVNVLVLRAPSDFAKQHAESVLADRRFHLSNVEKMATEEILEKEKAQRKEDNKHLTAKFAYMSRFHAKHVAKGPNPLSIMPKLTSDQKKHRKFILFGNLPTAEKEKPDGWISRSRQRRKRERAEIAQKKKQQGSLISPNSTDRDTQSTMDEDFSNSLPTTNKNKQKEETHSSSDVEDSLEELLPPPKRRKYRKRRKPRSSPLSEIEEDSATGIDET